MSERLIGYYLCQSDALLSLTNLTKRAPHMRDIAPLLVATTRIRGSAKFYVASTNALLCQLLSTVRIP